MGGTARRLLGCLLIAAVILLAPASRIGAQTVGDDPFDCGADIVDGAGVLDTSTLASVAGTVDDAHVVIRSFESVRDGDLPATSDDLIAACFADDEGAIDGDLALFTFSVEDRAADVFLGPALPGGSIPTELAETMAASFPDDFTQGVVNSLTELDNRLGAGSEPSAAEGTTSGAGDGAATESDDGGGISTGVLLGSTAVLGAGAGGWMLIRRRRTLTEARNELAASVIGPRARVGAVREHVARLDGQADLWGKIATGATLETLHELRHRARSAANDTERAAGLLSEATPGGIGEASTENLAKAEERLVELVAVLDRNEKTLDELFAFGARLDHLRVALPAKKELLFGELEASKRLVATRDQEGWEVAELQRELLRVQSDLEAADLNDFALDLLTLSDRVEQAEARLFAADHELQSLPDRPGSLEAWRAKQNEAVELERRRIDQARRALGEVGQLHSSESWHWAADFPDRAAQHLDEAGRLGDEAMALVPGQEFTTAGRVLEQAGLQLIGADDLLDQVDDLVIDLDQARMEAPGILAESHQVADQFGTYVEQHRRDLDAHLVAKPGMLDEALAGLALELRQPRPNYLRVAQTADRLNRELDELLAAAQEQHQRMEALRRQAEREVARAVRSIRRAKESLGWQLIPSREARSIDRLERELGSLPTEPGARFDAARDLADHAVAIQERIIADRRRRGNWVIVGGGASSGSWGGSSSSSGTGGGGRSFGGGGGGISFGGGGGGRSFGGGRGTAGW